MSSDASPQQSSRGRFGRLLPTSMAGRAALVTACVLWLLWLVIWLVRWTQPQLIPPAQAITWLHALVEFVLVLVTPFVLYWGLTRWSQAVDGAYPDIDQAWNAGVEALEQQGINISDLPVFLILGSAGSAQEGSLFNALGTTASVRAIPNAPGISHALQWYVSEEAIYLFCPGVSSLSVLAGSMFEQVAADSQATSVPLQPAVRGPAVAENALANPIRRTPPGKPSEQPAKAPPVSDGPAASSGGKSTTGAPDLGPSSGSPSTPKPASAVGPQGSPVPGGDYMGTIGVAQMSSQQATDPRISSAQRAAEKVSKVKSSPKPLRSADLLAETPASPAGTVFADQEMRRAVSSLKEAGNARSLNQVQTSESAADSQVTEPTSSSKPAESGSGTAGATASSKALTSPTPPSVARTSVRQLALPPALDTTGQLPRLQYLCKLLKRVRQPRCGINGVLTLIPFSVSREGPLKLSALSQSARGDVGTIQETLGVRFPVTVMLDGLEQDKGFNELVQRLQPELLSRRLGGRFDLRSRPTPEELNAHSDRLCDAFEDWVYRLFGREEALAEQRGNRKLYGLISRIRHDLKPRLRIFLGEAFGCEAENHQHDEAFYFSGCYFATSGMTSGQAAFVKGVLRDKLIEEQSQVSWTRDALKTHHWFRLATLAGWVVAILLLMLLLAQWSVA